MKNRVLCLLTLLLSGMVVSAQNFPGGFPHGKGGDKNEVVDSWKVDVNTMDAHSRQKISEYVEEMQMRGGADRAFLADVLNVAKLNSVTTVIDIVSTEVFELANFRKNKKNEWRKMIDRENVYKDSLSYVETIQEFYSETSRYGALDPSNINFDGITVRGHRYGKEYLYMSCHIDMTRLDHLFRHSKFYLVLDTLSFNPYGCHLPNVEANGIRLKNNGESPRDNRFSFSERNGLSFSMEMTLSSSWINQAVVLQRNVPLGTFRMHVNIPDGIDVYTYSRKEIDDNRKRMELDPSLNLPTEYIEIEGDCFVVPRSFMPVGGSELMWGTGEYDLKVNIQEKCRFEEDPDKNMRLKNWYKDYKQLLEMQKEQAGAKEYFQKIWQQNGNTLMKTIVKQSLTTGAGAIGLSGSSSSAARTGMSGSSGTGASGMPGASGNTGGKPAGFSK